ncbi:hypothetical protein ABZV65_04360 [Streptomyces bauhiniae]|uniref:hypothetical protein n=1 Tax=Streptomyces bauhiniae TaxID=2340725 RepID=UPI0033B5603E
MATALGLGLVLYGPDRAYGAPRTHVAGTAGALADADHDGSALDDVTRSVQQVAGLPNVSAYVAAWMK